ncbi:MAG: carbohydrate ABC transporter permease [Clostridiaceae bacterium]|nr:carbohydrate ABC transporter permease [Clostridiaceae bacterium]
MLTLIKKRKYRSYLRKSVGEYIFDTLNYIFMLIILIVCVYPFWNVIMQSLTQPRDANKPSLYLWVTDPSLASYRRMLRDADFLRSFLVTFARIAAAWSIGIVMTTFLAYALSRRTLPFRKTITGIVVFTMFFNGGMIPTYILMRDLKLLNNFWVLVLPGLVSTYNMIIMRNYFMSLPVELEESAYIDGANDFTIMSRIYVPLSKPILATVSLWIIVAHWNSWFDNLIYTPMRRDLTGLQLYLNQVLVAGTINVGANPWEYDPMNPNLPVEATLKATIIVISTVPILVFYPFLQKYFVKGIIIGSLKG